MKNNKTFFDLVERKRQEIIDNGGICLQDVINLEAVLKDSYDGDYESPILQEGVTLTKFTKQRSEQYHQVVINSLTNILKARDLENIKHQSTLLKDIDNAKAWAKYLSYLKLLVNRLKELDPALIEQIQNVNYVVYDKNSDSFIKKTPDEPLLGCIAHTELKDVILKLPALDAGSRELGYMDKALLHTIGQAVVSEDDMVIEVHANDIAYQLLLAIGENRDNLQDDLDLETTECPRQAFLNIKSWYAGNVQYDYSMTATDLVRLMDRLPEIEKPLNKALKWLHKLLGEYAFSSGLITKTVDITWLPGLPVKDLLSESTDATLRVLTRIVNIPKDNFNMMF